MSSSFLDVRQPVTYALLLRPETVLLMASSYIIFIGSITMCIQSFPSILEAVPGSQKIEPSTDVLKGILRPVVEGVKEISWPPRDPEAINQMEKVCTQVSALLRQEKEDIDKPRLAAKLQKVLQLYAATVLYKRSYAKKGTLLKSLAHSKLPLSTNRISSRLHPIIGNQVVKAEHFLETLIKAPEEQWNKFFLEGLTLGKGEVTLEELSAVIKKRIECMLIRTIRRRFILDRVSQRDRVQSK
ncbi:hypothetical protein Bca4012_045660 [Brassica carinata]